MPFVPGIGWLPPSDSNDLQECYEPQLSCVINLGTEVQRFASTIAPHDRGHATGCSRGAAHVMKLYYDWAWGLGVASEGASVSPVAGVGASLEFRPSEHERSLPENSCRVQCCSGSRASLAAEEACAPSPTNRESPAANCVLQVRVTQAKGL
eukprot:1976026-Amphidinium_carterae.1